MMYWQFTHFYGRIIFHCMDIPYLFIQSSADGHLSFFPTYWLLSIMLLWTFMYKFLFEHLFSILLKWKFQVMWWFCASLLRKYQTVFYSGCTILHSYQQCISVLISLHPYQQLSFFIIIIIIIKTILHGGKWYFIVVLICISPMTKNVGHLLIGHLYIFFRGMSIWVLCPFLNWVGCLFAVEL